MRSTALLVAALCLACDSDDVSSADTLTLETTGEGSGGDPSGADSSAPTTSTGGNGSTSTTGADPTTTTSGSVTTTTSTSSGSGSDTTDGGDSSSGGGTAIDAEFETVNGIVCFEAENYYAQVNNEQIQAVWHTFTAGEPDPEVSCVTEVVCNDNNSPQCNQYSNCDGDAIDPAEAIGGAYVEPLPDRRRDDSEPGTGGLGVVNNPEEAPTLEYRVNFRETGRFYVWAHARGLGPAANGLHVGFDGTWPDNDLIDPSSMRLQFPNGWQWTQDRRGGTAHTGVPAGDGVSRRDANVWLEINDQGVHTITLAMREDGLELDKICLALDPNFEPEGDGPAETTIGN